MENQYKCPNCYLDGSEAYSHTIIKCESEYCKEIVCERCFDDHVLEQHSDHRELTEEEAQKYRISEIHGDDL